MSALDMTYLKEVIKSKNLLKNPLNWGRRGRSTPYRCLIGRRRKEKADCG